jgi:hypothetical protein
MPGKRQLFDTNSLARGKLRRQCKARTGAVCESFRTVAASYGIWLIGKCGRLHEHSGAAL